MAYQFRETVHCLIMIFVEIFISIKKRLGLRVNKLKLQTIKVDTNKNFCKNH